MLSLGVVFRLGDGIFSGISDCRFLIIPWASRDLRKENFMELCRGIILEI